MVDYEKYKYFCEVVVCNGVRLLIRLTTVEQREATQAFEKLAIEQYL